MWIKEFGGDNRRAHEQDPQARAHFGCVAGGPRFECEPFVERLDRFHRQAGGRERIEPFLEAEVAHMAGIAQFFKGVDVFARFTLLSGLLAVQPAVGDDIVDDS